MARPTWARGRKKPVHFSRRIPKSPPSCAIRSSKAVVWLAAWLAMLMRPNKALVGLAVVLIFNVTAIAQEPSPQATAAAMERLAVEAIAKAEKSVVAISRVRRIDEVA